MNEGNEVTRDGDQGIGATHSTGEGGEPAPRDPLKGRGGRIVDPLGGKVAGRSSPTSTSTKLRRVARLSRERPEMVWTTLNHLIDIELLQEAYRLVRKDGAVGVDHVTAEQYAQNLTSNLECLLRRFKDGSYHAPPVRRIYIPKERGAERPIGIPTFEDKLLQRAVMMVLEAVYEEDFLDCSYGFRRGRSPHKALHSLRDGLMGMNGGFVLEIDIRSFFDEIDHTVLRTILDCRIRDGVIRRAIGKWLRAGVFEKGEHRQSDRGSPQGGVISPLLANVMLHSVLDVWFRDMVCPRLRGMAFMVRFADDAVLAFEHEDDAQRVHAVIGRRFERFGLRLQEEKTRLVGFKRPTLGGSRRRGDSIGPRTFDFLGFTHLWARSRRGRNVIKRQTSRTRLSRGLRAVSTWCRNSRHLPLVDQHRLLCRKLQGHYAYFGIRGNSHKVAGFARAVAAIWRRWIGRRSHAGKMQWARFSQIRGRFPLPPPRVVHVSV